MVRNGKENRKMFYRVIKAFTNKPEHRLQQIKAKNGKVLIEEEKIVDRWKEYFEELLNTEIKEAPRTNNDIMTALDEVNLKKVEISLMELREAITKIKIARAPGTDEVYPEMTYMGSKVSDTFCTESISYSTLHPSGVSCVELTQ